LTKLWTFSTALRLVAKGKFRLDDSVSMYLEELEACDTGKATLEQLLAHEAGFAPWLPFFESVTPSLRGTSEARKGVIRLAMEAPLEYEIGARAVYSDLGYIVLGHLLERMTGLFLGDLFDEQVNRPLGIEGVQFRPLGSFALESGGSIAATEDCPWRERVLVGEVHDDNAWTMGGSAGHAGLFASAEHVLKLGTAWLQALKGGGWLPRSLARSAITERGTGRALGWDMKSAHGSSAGEKFGSRSFGHLGFTGCSIWGDPDWDLVAVFLTNRVCFGRSNTGLQVFRPLFHDTLVGALKTVY
jgi:CubicO group peptidase (beta-lactamase class C family)